MPDAVVDPRALDERPPHWHYGCAPQLGYDWDEWVAMSELMIGPEQVGRNDDGRVTFVSLSGRTIANEKLQHLSSFPELSCVNLSHSSVNDDAVPYLLRIPKLTRIYVDGSAISSGAEFRLRWNDIKVGGDSLYDELAQIFGLMLVSWLSVMILGVIWVLIDWLFV